MEWTNEVAKDVDRNAQRMTIKPRRNNFIENKNRPISSDLCTPTKKNENEEAF